MSKLFKLIVLIFFALILSVNFSSAAKGEIVHISCKEDSRVLFDRNFKEEPQVSERKVYVRTFDLNKQLLLDTNFNNNKPLVAFIDNKSIYWHSAAISKPKHLEAFKSKYGQELLIGVGVFKINRYTGKINNDFYGLDRNYFAKYYGAQITTDKSKFRSILERNYNTKQGLRIKKRVVEEGEKNIKNKEIQEGFVRIARSVGSCKKVSKAKKF